jgi:ribose transport system permease protein
MTETTITTETLSPDDNNAAERLSTSQRSRWHALSFRNISAVYVGIGLFALFAVWVPGTFLTTTTLKSLLDEQAITAIVAVGLVVPLAAGAFDLSVGYMLGFGAILAPWLIGIQGFPVVVAIVLAILGCGLFGALNGTLVTVFGINSFIATLAVSSILSAMINWVSGGEDIIGLSSSFSNIANDTFLGIALPVYYLLALALALWYVLEHTPWGRYLYATGGNPEAARLAGVPTARLVWLALLLAAVFAGFAGVLESAQLQSGSPSVGPDYLLPVFAGVFLGSTQIRPGHFNVWGTVLAVYVLAMGVKGLQLAGAPSWLPDMFNGVALIVAVGLSRGEHLQQVVARTRARRPGSWRQKAQR